MLDFYDPDGDGVSVAYINGDDIPDAYHWGDRYLFNFNPDVDDYFESTGWDMWGDGSQLQVTTPWGPPRIVNMF